MTSNIDFYIKNGKVVTNFPKEIKITEVEKITCIDQITGENFVLYDAKINDIFEITNTKEEK